jgi:hypothetical protein
VNVTADGAGKLTRSGARVIGRCRGGYWTRVRHETNARRSAHRRADARQTDTSRYVGERWRDVPAARAPVSKRVVCPCGCLFQAVSDSDECWTCGRSAATITAEQDAIVAGIRGLPERDPAT